MTALLVLGNDDGAEHKIAQARAKFERALALDPSNADAHLNYGNALPTRQALAQNLEAVQLDPRNATAQNNLAIVYLDLGEYAQALAPLQALMKLTPHNADSAMGLALIYSLLHRPEDAVKAFDLAQPDTELAKALVAAGRLTYQSVLDPKLHAQALAAVEALRRRSDLDPDSMVNVMQLDLALGRNDTVLDQLPKWCASIPVACTDLSINPAWLPLRGDPRLRGAGEAVRHRLQTRARRHITLMHPWERATPATIARSMARSYQIPHRRAAETATAQPTTPTPPIEGEGVVGATVPLLHSFPFKRAKRTLANRSVRAR